MSVKIYRAFYNERRAVRVEAGGDSNFSHWEKTTGQLRVAVGRGGRIYDDRLAELLIRTYVDDVHRDDPMYKWLGFEEVGGYDVVLGLG